MKKINKQAVETFKTVLIAILITAIVAFIAGANYQARVNAQVKTVEVPQETKPLKD